MFLFTGFNGFGQFGNTETKQTTYKEVNKCDVFFNNDTARDDNNDNDKAKKSDIFDKPADNDFEENVLIAPSWRYTAYAVGTQLWLRGLLYRERNEVLKIQTPGVIEMLGVCDKYCLVLLANGQLYKIESKLKATLQLIQLEEDPMKLNLPQKRTIFGLPKRRESNDNDDDGKVKKIRITHVACGSHIAAAISDTNVIYSIPSILHRLERHRHTLELRCGFEHAMLLDANGDLFTWGNGLRGQLGHRNLSIAELPVQLEALAGIKIVCIAAGGWHSAAVSISGDLYTWGSNSNGQLGFCIRKVNSSLKFPTVYPIPQLRDLECCQRIGKACFEKAPNILHNTYTTVASTSAAAALASAAAAFASTSDAATLAITGVDGAIASNNAVVAAVSNNPVVAAAAAAAAALAAQMIKFDCVPLHVYAGARHTVVQMSCGNLWTVGWSKHGQLGVRMREPCSDDFLLVNVPNKCYRDVTCGPWCTVIVK